MRIGARALVPIAPCGPVRARICLRGAGARLVPEPQLLIGDRALVLIAACGPVRVRICFRGPGARLVLEPWCLLVPKYMFAVDAGIIMTPLLNANPT